MIKQNFCLSTISMNILYKQNLNLVSKLQFQKSL